jgi:hypothetical protein
VRSECSWIFGLSRQRVQYHNDMGARTLVTFEQFEQCPDDGMKHELLKGEHIVVPPPKSRHTRVQQKIQDASGRSCGNGGSAKCTSRRGFG